jgi:D-amino-acid dehydrogenase
MRVAVIGAGIVGVSTAEWLRRDGHEVTLIDRIEPGDPAQTSYGNAGILASSGIIPVAVPGLVAKAPKMLLDPLGPLHLRWRHLPRLLPWLMPFLRRATMPDVERTASALADLLGGSVDQHRALARGTPAERFIREGPYIHLYRNRAEYEADEPFHAVRRAHGLRMEERDRARLLQDDPWLGEHYGFAACWMDNGWITDPGAYVAALFDHFRRHGGSFLRGEAGGLRPLEEGAEVTVAGETRRFDRAVLSAGAWSATLARRLGHDPKLETERGYHLVLRGPNRRPPFPYSLSDGKFIATPMDAGIRAAGQVEFGGFDPRLSEKPFRIFRTRLLQLYPDLEWEGEERWLGHRPSTVDALPFIGPSPKVPAIYFAFGAQHVGLTSGPRTGRLIADLVAGRTPNIDISPFRVGRFDRSAA